LKKTGQNVLKTTPLHRESSDFRVCL